MAEPDPAEKKNPVLRCLVRLIPRANILVPRAVRKLPSQGCNGSVLSGPPGPLRCVQRLSVVFLVGLIHTTMQQLLTGHASIYFGTTCCTRTRLSLVEIDLTMN